MAKTKFWTPKRKKRLRTTAIWTTLGLITYETYLATVVRRQKRRDIFNLALQAKQSTSKPLLVIGAPRARLINRLLGPDHDCGDMCLDESGPIFQALSTMGPNTYVVYVSQKLENLDDIESTMGELQRVSGGDLFITHAEPYSLTAWLRPGARQRILSAPPTTPYTEWKDLPWRPGPAEVHRLPEFVA